MPRSCGHSCGGRYASSASTSRRSTDEFKQLSCSRSCKMLDACPPLHSARVRGGPIRGVRPPPLRLLQGGPGTLRLPPSKPARAQYPPPVSDSDQELAPIRRCCCCYDEGPVQAPRCDARASQTKKQRHSLRLRASVLRRSARRAVSRAAAAVAASLPPLPPSGPGAAML